MSRKDYYYNLRIIKDDSEVSATASSKHQWIALLIVLMAILDVYIVFVAYPSIQHGLHASSDQIQFVIAGYTIAYAVNLVTAGRLGDTYGRKRMFIIGMASFIVTSTMCAFAQSPQTLIITRVFQGIAAALMYPQALSIIQATFTSKERNIAVALFGANVGIAAIAGQILGGFLVQINLFNLDWRLVFLVNVPIGIGTLIAASRMVHESKSEKPVRIDIGGAAILSVILFLLLYPLIEGRNAGWPLWMYAAIILSIILIFPFVLFERRLSISEHNDNIKGKESQSVSKLPLMPLSLFKDRGFVIGMSIVLVFFIGSPVFIFILSFYLQNGLGFSPLTSGLSFLPMGIGILISSLITPKIVPKLDANILKIGALVIIIGFGFLIVMTHQQWNIGLHWSQLLPCLFIIGMGQGLVIVPLINIILSHVKDQKHTGAVSGILTTMIQIGISIGIALIGSIFFGMVGTGYNTTHVDNYSNNLGNNIKIHYYNNALVSSMLYTISLVIMSLFLVFLLPSRSHKENYQHA